MRSPQSTRALLAARSAQAAAKAAEAKAAQKRPGSDLQYRDPIMEDIEGGGTTSGALETPTQGTRGTTDGPDTSNLYSELLGKFQGASKQDQNKK